MTAFHTKVRSGYDLFVWVMTENKKSSHYHSDKANGHATIKLLLQFNMMKKTSLDLININDDASLCYVAISLRIKKISAQFT